MMNGFSCLDDKKEERGNRIASPLLLFLLDLNQGPSD